MLTPPQRRYELFSRYLTVFAVSHSGTEEELEAYARRVSVGYRPPLRPQWPPEVSSLISACWAQDPAQRPAMDEVVERLKKIDEGGLFKEAAQSADGCCVIS